MIGGYTKVPSPQPQTAIPVATPRFGGLKYLPSATMKATKEMPMPTPRVMLYVRYRWNTLVAKEVKTNPSVATNALLVATILSPYRSTNIPATGPAVQ